MTRFVIASTFLILSACSVTRPAADDTGEEIYQQLCANCHGVDLEGGPLGPSLGPGSNSSDQPDSFIEFAIVNGKGSMPSFESSLNNDQVDALIGYIKAVQGE